MAHRAGFDPNQINADSAAKMKAFAEHIQTLFELHQDDDKAEQFADPVVAVDISRANAVEVALWVRFKSGDAMQVSIAPRWA
jgi:hypothetical protein